MKIGEGTYVSMEFRLALDSGEEVDRSEDGKPLGFLFGSGVLLEGLEQKLEGLEKGATVSFTLEPEDGYGFPRPGLVREFPRDAFPDGAELKPGLVFQAMGPNGPRPAHIKAIRGDTVEVDFNHPLCGERLHFEVTVANVREATEADRAACGGGCGGGCGCGPESGDGAGGPPPCGGCSGA